jgi:hypothetical protein
MKDIRMLFWRPRKQQINTGDSWQCEEQNMALEWQKLWSYSVDPEFVPKADYLNKCFCIFTESIQENIGIIPQITPRSLHFT